MKNLLTITLILLSIKGMGQTKKDSAFINLSYQIDSSTCSREKNDLIQMEVLTIMGFKAIRHDALIRLKFHYAHRIELVIEDMEYQLMKNSNH